MPLEEKPSEDKLLFGLLLHDPILFPRFFWKDELSLPLSFNQRLMYGDQSERILYCTGRKTAKTIRLESKIIQKSIEHQGGYAEAMFFTPGQVHMAPVRDRIISRLNRNPLFRAIKGDFNKNEGLLQFGTGLKWFFRIEGSSGTEENMVGPRCIYIYGDELAFGGERCHKARFQTALPGCEWLYAGVPAGVRDSPFYRLDQTEEGVGWSKHKLTSYDNPIYQNEEARQRLVKDHGGVNTQQYITQVLGQWGEEVFSSFPPGTIAIKPTLPYAYQELTGNQVERMIKDNTLGLQVRLPRVGAERYIISMDYGFSPDPSVIGVFYEHNPKTWYQLARFKLLRVTPLHQAKFLDYLNVDLLDRKVVCISCDKVDIRQILINKDETTSLGHRDDYEAKCLDSNPGGTVEMAEGTEIVKVRRKQWMTEELRKSMSYANLGVPYDYLIWLAQDDEVEQELRGTTERKTPAGMVVYAPQVRGQEHGTDMLRYLVAAVHHISEPKYREEDLSAYGWARVMSPGQDWTPPWG